MAAFATLGLLGACAGERPSLAQAVVGTTGVPNPTTTTVPVGPAGLVPGPDTLLGYIATPTQKPVVRAEPTEESASIDVPAETSVGAPTTFAVLGDASAVGGDGWYQVLLPTRPNGTTAWVPAGSVTITRTPLRVLVDLDARSLRVEDGVEEALVAPIAIGTAENPTPVGTSYVTELIDNVEPDGAYGPYAFGLALHSDTLTEFAGGPGQVGIHGTNTPALIGEAVSHGCVRLTNEDVQRLVDLQLPLGVPVFIS